MHRLKLGFPDIVFIAVFVIALASGSRMLSIDSDLGRHLTLGNYILDERIIPTRDLLSHTQAGLSRPPYEWLSQVVITLGYRILNLDGVILLTALTLAITFSLVYKYSDQRSNSPILSLFITFIAVGASTIHWIPRPHIITFFLLAIWIECFEKLVKGKLTNKLYVFPVLMLFWANLHGGFIFGILVWVAYFAGWLWDTWQGKINGKTGRAIAIAGTTSLIATVITPDLWHNWDAVLNNRSAFILNRTIETMRPDLVDLSILPYTLLLGLIIFFLAINRKIIKANHFFLLIGFGIMSLLMARNIPLFAIVCAPILSDLASKYFSKFKTWERINEMFAGFRTASTLSVWPVVATIIAVLYFALFNLKYKHSYYHFNPAVFPMDATAFLKENPLRGNMFNEFNWGGYLEYKLFPLNKVFLDSQSDFYGESLMREYDQIISANSNWMNLLDKHQVEWVIIPNSSPLAKAIINNMKWEIVYKDAIAIIGIQK